VRFQRKPLVWAARPGGEQGRRYRLVVSCFVTRAGYRRGGVTRALARAAVDFARDRGARALEGYPMIVQSGEDISWGELHTSATASSSTPPASPGQPPDPAPRVVMRIDLRGAKSSA
jgi:GNAT superfamily N-acetyltransferase